MGCRRLEATERDVKKLDERVSTLEFWRSKCKEHQAARVKFFDEAEASKDKYIDMKLKYDELVDSVVDERKGHAEKIEELNEVKEKNKELSDTVGTWKNQMYAGLYGGPKNPELEAENRDLRRELKDTTLLMGNCKRTNDLLSEGKYKLAAELVEKTKRHDSMHTKYCELHTAASDLYYAAHWSPDRTVNAVKLWTRLRDIAGFDVGFSPKPNTTFWFGQFQESDHKVKGLIIEIEKLKRDLLVVNDAKNMYYTRLQAIKRASTGE